MVELRISTVIAQLPRFKIDTAPLHEKAKAFEEHLRSMRKQAEPSMPDPYKDMYA